MNKRKLVRIIMLILAAIGVGLFAVGYAKFVTNHRTSILIICTMLIILCMGLQCYFKTRQVKKYQKGASNHRIYDYNALRRKSHDSVNMQQFKGETDHPSSITPNSENK